MQEKENLKRIFFSSFFITLIVAAFFMCLLFVDLKASESGFEGLFAQNKIERTAPLLYTVTIGSHSISLDLEYANKLAAKIQAAEAWLLPEEYRFISRVSVFIGEKIANGKTPYQKHEHYRNAGLV